MARQSQRDPLLFYGSRDQSASQEMLEPSRSFESMRDYLTQKNFQITISSNIAKSRKTDNSPLLKQLNTDRNILDNYTMHNYTVPHILHSVSHKRKPDHLISLLTQPRLIAYKKEPNKDRKSFINELIILAR